MKIGELITKSEPAGQFRLIDVFGVVTFVAVLLATLTPLLRLIDRANLTLVVTPASALPVLIHFAVVMLALSYAIYQRKRLEEKAGRRLGVAFCAPTKWEYWLPSREASGLNSILTLIGLICLQLVFVALILDRPVATQFWSQDIFMLALHSGQLGLICGGVVVNFLWRVYPGTVEFFESGIAVRQVFHPWTDIELRTIAQSDNRIRLVVSRKLAGVPQVSEELASAIRDHHAKASSNQVHPLDRAC